MKLLRLFFAFSLWFVSLPTFAIVGGVAASATDSPGQVALVDVSRSAEGCTASELFCKQYCSGLLIAPSWVLTAAHCADDGAMTGNIRVVVGTTDLYGADISQVITVQRKYVHPDYARSAAYDSDIALLHLSTPVASSTMLASLVSDTAFNQLETTASTTNDEVRAAGWGRLSSAGAFPKTLRRVDVDLIDDAVCDARFNVGLTRYIASSMLCVIEDQPEAIEQDDAGDLSPLDEEGEGVCNYDSGGPLSYFYQGQWQVVGLVSFAPSGDCASKTIPSVFTRVLPFVPWIEQTMRLAGEAVGDLALTVSGNATELPAAISTVTVRLSNNSQLPPGSPATSPAITGVGFTLTAAGAASVAVVASPAGLSCVAITDGLRCTSTSALAAGAFREANFTITPAAGDQHLDVQVVSFNDASNNLFDYRSANDRVTHSIIFSDKPNISLVSVGFSQVLVNTTASHTDGRAWIIGTLSNHSGSVSATTELQAVLPAGFEFEAWEGLPECSAVNCSLTLNAGEQREFKLRVFVPDAVSGTVALSASAQEGDYPTADTAASVAVAFNVVVDDSVVVTPPTTGQPGVVATGGGALDALSLLSLMVLLLTLYTLSPQGRGAKKASLKLARSS